MFLPLAVMKDMGTKITISPVVGSLTNAAALVDEDLVETTVGRTGRVGLAQVPLPEDASAVASGLERVRHSGDSSP